ncbi:MAG: MBL fold metallo-hydrolase [Geobacteraceae bacterium GWC2_53_11]|nr:MAG: MBL fold metallo-hydrolase [Geobacteraceae bacterium GWC2_53_11]
MQITPQLTIPFTVPSPGGPIPRSANLFLVIGKDIILIDSGVRGCENAIFDYLQSLGRQSAEIAHLILTHAHPDHIGAARAVMEACACQVAAHGAERDWIEDVAIQERERPVPGFQTLVGGSVVVALELKDGDRIVSEEGVSLEVVHTPGHSSGSISLWLEQEQAVFCGDAVPLPGDMPIFTDYEASVASLERLRALEAEWLLSAWDEPRHGDAVERRIDEALQWLELIRRTVRDVARQSFDGDALALCRQVVPLLGLSPFAANPLVARSFAACL